MKAISFLGAVLVIYATQAGAQDKWTVHEWGTFTSLQNESGETIGGINTDDEPVPGFVHRLMYGLLLQPTQVPIVFSKGAPRCHPDVTMRLETPVIYFHPPSSETPTTTANVHVEFRGGWLTEYYPYAEPLLATAPANTLKPELFRAQAEFTQLRSDTESSLAWNDVALGGNWEFTNTTAHVWISPRAVNAAAVRTTNGESDRFLFYRGIAHIDAPLKVSRDINSGELLIRSQLKDLPSGAPLAIRSLWLVDIDAHGRVAFRSLPPVSLDKNPRKILAHTPAGFGSRDFSADNLDQLKSSLRSALIAEGLFADEAEALLKTWEVSYFKSSGLRLFFLVPRAWTDFYLPLDISLPSDINRVMVGRIELVTPEQREKLHEISGFSEARIKSDLLFMNTGIMSALRKASSDRVERLYSGGEPLSSEISVPATYQTYLDLGRFRNALVLDEAKHNPGAGLTNFIAAYGLNPLIIPTSAAEISPTKLSASR